MKNLEYKKDVLNNFGPEYSALSKTLGEEIVQILKHFQIKKIYGIGGDFVAPIVHLLDPHFELIACANEMHAGFTACGDAEITGLSACFITYTVGSLPCMSALALAKTESLPVIFISGAPGPHELQNIGIHHMIHASRDWQVDDTLVLKSVQGLGIRAERLKWASNKDQPTIANEQFLELIEHALKKREPVFIEIPRGILDLPTQSFSNSKTSLDYVTENQKLTGAEQIADNIFNKLSTAKNPFLIIGERIKANPLLKAKVQSFIEKTQIAYSTNVFAKGMFDESAPNCLGVFNGLFGSEIAQKYYQTQCDYILEICTSIIPQDTATGFGTGAVDVASFQNKTRLRGTHHGCQDVLDVFLELEKKNLPKYSFKKIQPKTHLDPKARVSFANVASIFNALQSDSKETFVYLPELGNSYFSSFSLETRASKLGRSWLANPYYAAMGTALPYAKAVCEILKARSIDEIPVALVGDGGFHFMCNEFATLQRDHSFLIVVIFRNNIFHLGKINNSPSYQVNSETLDYQKLISAYGGLGYCARTAEDLMTAFLSAKNSKKGLHLIEVPVGISESDQSREVQLINLYIRARTGHAESLEKWNKIVEDSQTK